MAEHKLRLIWKLFIPQVIIKQVSFFSQTTALSIILECKIRKTLTHVLEPVMFCEHSTRELAYFILRAYT